MDNFHLLPPTHCQVHTAFNQPVGYEPQWVCVMGEVTGWRVAQLKWAVEVVNQLYLRPANDCAISDDQEARVTKVSRVQGAVPAIQREDTRSAAACTVEESIQPQECQEGFGPTSRFLTFMSKNCHNILLTHKYFGTPMTVTQHDSKGMSLIITLILVLCKSRSLRWLNYLLTIDTALLCTE